MQYSESWIRGLRERERERERGQSKREEADRGQRTEEKETIEAEIQF